MAHFFFFGLPKRNHGLMMITLYYTTHLHRGRCYGNHGSLLVEGQGGDVRRVAVELAQPLLVEWIPHVYKTIRTTCSATQEQHNVLLLSGASHGITKTHTTTTRHTSPPSLLPPLPLPSPPLPCSPTGSKGVVCVMEGDGIDRVDPFHPFHLHAVALESIFLLLCLLVGI